MFEGSVTFRTSLPEIKFDAIEFATKHPGTTRATITSDAASGVTLRVAVTSASSVFEAIASAQELTQQVTNILSFRFGLGIDTFRFSEYALVELSAQGSTHHLGDCARIEGRCLGTTILGTQSRQELSELLEQPQHPGYHYYDLFRAALCLSDPLSKFMALYSIILSLSGDDQQKVDEFVMSIRPSIATNSPWKRKSGFPETVYTRLRNEVGHVRPRTTIRGTRDEMEINLSGLIEVAKKKIRTQP